MAEFNKSRSVFLAFCILTSATLGGCGGGGGGGSKSATVASSTTPTTETPAPTRTTPSPFDPMPQTPDTTPAPTPAPQPTAPPAANPTPSPVPTPAPTAPSASNGRTLNWTAPTQNDDGTATALAGFTVVYGPDTAMLHESIRIDNPSVSSYVLDSLPKGTYYVAVKAVAADGVESDASNVVKMVL
jgi:hypothetical protein